MFRLSPILFPIAFAICLTLANPCQSQEGLWDAQLECRGGPIRFGLKLEHSQSDDQWSAWLVNGSEQIKVPNVKADGENNIVLSIDHYDSQLTLVHAPKSKTGDSESHLTGTWKKLRSADKWVKMKLSATPHDVIDSAADQSSSASKFDGRWQVKFSSSDEPAVGVFKTDPQNGKLGGTFLTTTGDYRFLSGTFEKNEMAISCFDGAHAFLFKATLDDAGSIAGDFWSSKTWHETWTATRSENAKLPDSFGLTKATEANINSLSFPDLDGKPTGLDAEQFAAPVRLVHIFGSWCPNCHDAAVYLAELEAKYGKKVSVVGIAFEHTGDLKRDADQVRKYLKHNKLDHPVLIGGNSDKAKASKAISIIDEVRSYPTTIFADRSGKIIAIHQGFSGPATGEDYVNLKKKFESTIDEVLESQDK